MLDQNDNSFATIAFSWRGTCSLVLALGVPPQDRALRKRNLSGGPTLGLSDSATAPVAGGRFPFPLNPSQTKAQCDKLPGLVDSQSLRYFAAHMKFSF